MHILLDPTKQSLSFGWFSLKLVGEDGYVVTEAGFGADIGEYWI